MSPSPAVAAPLIPLPHSPKLKTVPNPTFTEHLIAMLGWSQQNLLDDFRALTPEQAVARPAPGASSPVEIAAHCATTARRLASVLVGGPPPFLSPEARQSYEAGLVDLEDALKALDAAYAEVRSAILAVGEDRWGETVEGPFGLWPLASFAALATGHTMYHDGQINLLDRMDGHLEMRWSARP